MDRKDQLFIVNEVCAHIVYRLSSHGLHESCRSEFSDNSVQSSKYISMYTFHVLALITSSDL